MGDPLSGAGAAAAARIDRLTAEAKAKAERYRAMQAQVGQVSATESSQDGLVTVTVDSAGNVTDLRITDKVREMSGEQVASAVLRTLRRAQSRLPEKLAAVMAETIGDDEQTMNTIVSNYRSKFPEPEEPDEVLVDERRVGELEDGEEPPPVSAPPPQRPKHDNEDEGWGDQSVFREE
jgi:DNA-binding protein YbaB